MLGALIIVFREVIEAGLIVGIVLAVTRGVAAQGTVGRRRRRRPGVLGGGRWSLSSPAALANALRWLWARRCSTRACSILAWCMLAWHNIWMASHGREMAAHLRHVGQEVAEGWSGPSMALAIVVAVAVLREGSEVVLFLYGIAASGEAGFGAPFAGGRLARRGARRRALDVMFFGLVKIPARPSVWRHHALITFLAAGMAAQMRGLSCSRPDW